MNDKFYIYYCQYGIIKEKKGPMSLEEFSKMKIEDSFMVIKSFSDLKVGDVINTLEEQVVKKNDDEIESYLAEVNTKNDIEILTKAFLNISSNYSKLVELRDTIEELKDSTWVDERFYRIVYHSFKMYNLKYQIYDLVDKVILVLGEKIPSNEYERVGALKKLKISELMINNFKELFNCRFDLSRNSPENWLKDTQVLTSNYILWLKLSESLHLTLNDLYLNKGFLFKDTSVISWHEGATMNFWEPFNNFRMMNKSEYLKLLDCFKSQSE